MDRLPTPHHELLPGTLWGVQASAQRLGGDCQAMEVLPNRPHSATSGASASHFLLLFLKCMEGESL